MVLFPPTENCLMSSLSKTSAASRSSVNPSRIFANGEVRVIGLRSSFSSFGGEILEAGVTIEVIDYVKGRHWSCHRSQFSVSLQEPWQHNFWQLKLTSLRSLVILLGWNALFLPRPLAVSPLVFTRVLPQQNRQATQATYEPAAAPMSKNLTTFVVPN